MFDRYITHNEAVPYEKSVTVIHESFDDSLNKLYELKEKIESSFIQERVLHLNIADIPVKILLFSKKINPAYNDCNEYLIVFNINGKNGEIYCRCKDILIDNASEIVRKIKESICKEFMSLIDNFIDVSAFDREFTYEGKAD